MDDSKDYIELVERAKFGARESLDRLAQRVRGRLYAYVYRITLKDDVSQDIVQESLLEMINNLNKLEVVDLFWPWLCGIAFNKIRRHYKQQRRHRTISISNYDDWPQTAQKDKQAGPLKLMGEELRQIVFDAMKRLKPHHRAVLAMRCYEEMQYSQIAELMGSSELNTRVMFYRAKEALRKQLSRKGFGKGFLLSALALFGKMTAPAEAAASPVTVTAAATNVGVTAALIAAASSKTAVITTTIAAGTVAAGSILSPISIDKALAWTDALQDKLTKSPVAATQSARERSEYWYYYPAKTDGPVMTRLIKQMPQTGRSYCQRLDNDQANYYFDKNTNTIHIINSRMSQSDLSVRRLPTDDLDFKRFLSEVEGREQTEQVEYIPTEHNGVLLVAGQDGSYSYSNITNHYNVLDEEYFQYDWPAGAKIIDNRDAMHKRGWTYFTVAGHIDEQELSGTGRIPFVYAASRRHYPWLKLQVADQLEIIDSETGAFVRDNEGQTLFTNPAGTFFQGLARPWMGLHTIDTIRRDAAEQRLFFETKRLGNSEVEVTITCQQNRIIYTIDMRKDVIEKITVTNGKTPSKEKAQLRFSYLDDIENLGDEFAEPRKRNYPIPQQQELGMLWLIQLTEGEFD